jgi:dihydroorotase
MLDFLIKGGHVMDPASGENGIRDIGVHNGRIVKTDGEVQAEHVVDAAGCYVFPGFIDAHAHAYYPGSGLGVPPDLQAATGVTTVIDAGTAGWSNYAAFHNTTVVNSMVRVKALVAYNNSGQIELGYVENYERASVKPEKIRHILERYPGEVLGIKLRFQKEVTGETGVRYLREAIEVAEECGCPITVHTTNPPATASEIADLLRPGDVYCHCYQGKGSTIIDKNGHVYEAVRSARERGVLFDAANGTGIFAFSTAVAAIKDGFFPDIISADNASNSYGLELYAKNLPFVMSKYLTLGLELEQVVRCVTENPAKRLGIQERIGTLAEGAVADIAIMKLLKKPQVYWDSVKDPSTQMYGEEILVPQMTLIAGMPAFRANDF